MELKIFSFYKGNKDLHVLTIWYVLDAYSPQSSNKYETIIYICGKHIRNMHTTQKDYYCDSIEPSQFNGLTLCLTVSSVAPFSCASSMTRALCRQWLVQNKYLQDIHNVINLFAVFTMKIYIIYNYGKTLKNYVKFIEKFSRDNKMYIRSMKNEQFQRLKNVTTLTVVLL